MWNSIRASPLTKVAIGVFCGFTVLFFLMNISGESGLEAEHKEHHRLSLRSTKMPEELRIVGGLGATREKNNDVQDVVNKIIPILSSKSGKKFVSVDVLSYKHQTVAGSNFFVKGKAKTESGETDIVHLRIYRNISQQLELTAYQLGKKLEEEVVWFQ